jgi:EAL domain-containing protein (putative c-di-GMP-specific phosphodiesterase class I)/DNA-binding response OmpR family regulator
MDEATLTDAAILVVDDEAANAHLLEAILARAGFRNVAVFTDARAALAAAEAAEPDLVLLDLHMPHLDGYELLAALRARHGPDTYLPVIVLTADTQSEPRHRALAAGATDFLTKPFDLEEVVLRCRNLLETRRLHQALYGRSERLAGQVRAQQATLEATHRERLAVAASLGRLHAGATPRETADAICAEVRQLRAMDVAAIIRFGVGGAESLAAVVPPDCPPPPRVLPRRRARFLAERARQGIWVEATAARHAIDRGSELFPGVDLCGVVHAPIWDHQRLLGILAAGTCSAGAAEHLDAAVPSIAEYAALAGVLLGPALAQERGRAAATATLSSVIRERAFRPVFQPIVRLDDAAIVGYEALTRFADGTRPDQRFAEADAMGLGEVLELACLEAALDAAAGLPAAVWLSVNVGPAVLMSETLPVVLGGVPRSLVVEITEHVAITDYPRVRAAVTRLGPHVCLAVDDAGAGYASLRHIVELRPAFMKLDVALIRDIDRDEVRQALVAGVDHFARRTGFTLIAEGVESAAERATLLEIGVPLAQGYLFGRPAPVRPQDPAA